MNPIEIMINQMFGNNPLFQRAKQMSQGKSEQQIMQIAKNLCKQRGISIDEAYSQFQNQMKQISGMFGNHNGINQ